MESVGIFDCSLYPSFVTLPEITYHVGVGKSDFGGDLELRIGLNGLVRRMF